MKMKCKSVARRPDVKFVADTRCLLHVFMNFSTFIGVGVGVGAAAAFHRFGVRF